VSEDPEESRIGVSGDGRLVQVEITIRDFSIGSGPSIGEDAWHETGVRDQTKVVDREIGNPGDMMFRHFEFAICETPMSGGQLSSWQRRRTEA
jgi:hypothetical protein